MTPPSDSFTLRERAPRVLSSLAGATLALLLPKCPLCVALLLSSIGLGASSATVLAPYVRPSLWCLALVPLLVLGYREWTRSLARRGAQGKLATGSSACSLCSHSSALGK